MSVYAGQDPVTKRRNYLRETIAAGPDAERLAEEARVRMLNEVYQRRHPRTNATVNQLLDRYFRQADWELNTLETYRGYAKKHIRPLLGKVKIGALDDDLMDSLYAELRRCSEHCESPRDLIDHRTNREHICDDRCTPHRCRPLKPSTIRQIHFIIAGAVRKAVKWKWIAINPIATAEPPAKPKANPKPPSPAEAAKIVSEAFKDPDWGCLVWLTLVTGHRRGELCAIRWRHLDLGSGVLHLERAIGQRGKKTWEKSTKTHQDRRIALDAETVQLLAEHRQRAVGRAKFLGGELSDDSFVFSRSADGSTHRLPDSVGQRYRKLTERLGIDSSIHKLRHYSATELIAAGVDVRTVAGRLGHGGGGTTTLTTYAAWVSEADQRAAGHFTTRMPPLPPSQEVQDTTAFVPTSPYEQVATQIRDLIVEGELPAGVPLPGVKRLASEHNVAPSTARRAIQLLARWGLVSVENGRPTLVLAVPPVVPAPVEQGLIDGNSTEIVADKNRELLELDVRHLGQIVSSFRAEADPANAAELRRLLGDGIRRIGGDEGRIGDYDLVARYAGERGVATTFAATA